MSAVFLWVRKNRDRPVFEGNDMPFGSDIRHSEGKDGKDSIKHIHGWGARWAGVVKGLQDRKLWPRPQKYDMFLYSSTKRCAPHA